MKKLLLIIFTILAISNLDTFGQFHNYVVKYGIQSFIIQPSTEFNNDSYKLSLLGRGFLRKELNSYLEAELGVAIGELNGKDPINKNWSTFILPTDLRIIFSPIASANTSPYFYSGIGLLRWNNTQNSSLRSPKKSDKIGWALEIPVGAGTEIKIGNETLLNLSFGYNFIQSDDINYFNSPDANDGYFNLGIGLTFVMGAGLTDEDHDGLNKDFEISIGTSPTNSDSDGDGITDYDEINTYNTNPLNKDTDNDGLTDFDEINIHNSDPKSIDTDGDDIFDGAEVNTYKTNPNSKDSDNDGLGDNYEINAYKTNPANNDSDSDKLYDKEEIQKYKTDPNNADTDGDGLSDGEEIIKYKTNPLVPDSENIQRISDDKAFNLNQQNQTILEGISFELNKAEILENSKKILQQALKYLNENSQIKIEIHGYTDNSGPKDFNKKLSQERADAVKLWFVQNGIDALRITAFGYGDSNPIADNNTEEGRLKNRRIEIVKIN